MPPRPATDDLMGVVLEHDLELLACPFLPVEVVRPTVERPFPARLVAGRRP